MGDLPSKTHVANAHKETVWVKIDGDQSLHQFQPVSPGVHVNTSGTIPHSITENCVRET